MFASKKVIKVMESKDRLLLALQREVNELREDRRKLREGAKDITDEAWSLRANVMGLRDALDKAVTALEIGGHYTDAAVARQALRTHNV